MPTLWVSDDHVIELARQLPAEKQEVLLMSLAMTKEQRKAPHTFVVGSLAVLFDLLSRLSLFYWIRALAPRSRTNDVFVEVWVLVQVVLSSLVLMLVPTFKYSVVSYLVLFYGGLRVIEVVVYQVNVTLFDPYRAARAGQRHRLRGYRRIAILLLFNYVEIILWFAAAYRGFSWAFKSDSIDVNGLLTSLYVSTASFTSFGQASQTPVSDGMGYVAGYLLILTQSLVGAFMTVVVLARFIALLPKPESMDEFEQE